MKRKELFLVLLMSLAISALVVCGVVWYGSRQPTQGGDFTLNHRGSNWNLSKNAKKLNLVYVGYSKCPDVCPLSLSYAALAFKKLSPEVLQQIQFIFVSVDVEHETPAGVADYATNFFPDFIGLTGTKDAIDKAISLFGASYLIEKNPKSYLGYSIAHTDRIFILDKKGIVLTTLPGLRTDQTLIYKIKELL